MGLFGGSSSDTAGFGGSSDNYGSKLRTPSYSSEFDSTGDSALGGALGGATSSMDLAGGDFEKGLQIEQQKATLMTQVNFYRSILFEKIT